jgi:hypothetical protein
VICRGRTVWTVAGAALVVAAAVVLPQALRTTTAAAPTGSGPTADPTARATALALQAYRVCPSAAHLIEGDASVLPDPQTAMAALLAAGALISSEQTFIARLAYRSAVKVAGVPHDELLVDVGDAAGYGSLALEIYPENDVAPAQRAARGANVSSCVDGQRYEFPDGSVGLYYPYGPPEREATLTHVWYFAAGGYTMNIGMAPEVQGSSPLPARVSMPLSIAQVMLLADAVARAA